MYDRSVQGYGFARGLRKAKPWASLALEWLPHAKPSLAPRLHVNALPGKSEFQTKAGLS